MYSLIIRAICVHIKLDEYLVVLIVYLSIFNVLWFCEMLEKRSFYFWSCLTRRIFGCFQ